MLRGRPRRQRRLPGRGLAAGCAHACGMRMRTRTRVCAAAHDAPAPGPRGLRSAFLTSAGRVPPAARSRGVTLHAVRYRLTPLLHPGPTPTPAPSSPCRARSTRASCDTPRHSGQPGTGLTGWGTGQTPLARPRAGVCQSQPSLCSRTLSVLVTHSVSLPGQAERTRPVRGPGFPPVGAVPARPLNDPCPAGGVVWGCVSGGIFVLFPIGCFVWVRAEGAQADR